MNRSEFLKKIGAGLVLLHLGPMLSKALAGTELCKALFGDEFKWGVTTAAYQFEGGWDADGKGPSIWDTFTHHHGHIKDKSNGDVSCDFYHRCEADLKLLKELHINNFRFSIAWSRVLPEGIGEVNEKGIAFYNRVIDTCLSLGIEPWVTLYHWDLPQALEDKGGWTNREIVNWFAEYTDLVTRRFGDRVRHWVVLNEPAAFTSLGYFTGLHAPGHRGLNKFLASVHYACLCQAEGGRIIRRNVANAHIGTTYSCSYIEAYKEKPRNQRAARRLDVFLNRLFIEPAMGMGYAFDDLPFLKRMKKYIEPGDMDKLRFDFDFIGLQNYFRIVGKAGIIPLLWANQVKPDTHTAELTEMGWEVYPEGIYKILKQFAKYPVKELMVSENGAAFHDELTDGAIHDAKRISFFKRYIENVLRAKQDGVNVTGYFAWTYVDNFEWAEGYRPKFGLVYNDVKTQSRVVKDSGLWFREFLK
jgi:beta-glucosidase